MKYILYLFSALVILVIVGIGVYAFFSNNDSLSGAPEQRACTLEAKLCPDGSAVGRTGPNCEFATCPLQ